MLRKLFTFKTSIQLILITTLLSNVGIFMVVPFLAIYLNKLHSLSAIEVGTIIGIAFWCQRAGSLLGGILSDYVHTKKTMLLGLAIRIPGYLIIGFTHNFYILLLSCAFIGLGSSIYLPAAKSFLVKNVSIAEKVDVLATRKIFANIGVASGPLIGMLIFKILPPLLFSLVGCIFFVLLLLNCALKENPDTNIGNKIHFSDFSKLLTNKTMLSIALFMFLFTFFYIQLEITIPLFSEQIFEGSATAYIFVFNAFVVIFFQIPVSRWSCKETTKTPIILSFVLFALSFIILHFLAHSYFYFFSAIIIFSFAEIILQIRLDYNATNIDERLIASAFGIMSLSSAFGGMAGSYLGSLLSNQEFFGLSVWQILSIASLSVVPLSLLIFKNSSKKLN
ncbi:MFS transporter [Bartonella doshiae]|uniref:Multidrug resistance protein MdtH n=2 Tax=Bartonella doshiae TaxID=33044 RepID=A0A380ZKB5_BARDO|nr:MFS transporter [Bartonella doshiae]SUV45466.1 Multidrug resistance protein MdtH [Bartonella doshiae]